MDNKIVFLFGAGISVKAGLPTGQELTEDLLKSKSFFRHSSGIYYWGTKRNCSDKELCCKQIYQGLHFVNAYLFKKLCNAPNYEEIYYYCKILTQKRRTDFDEFYDFIDKNLNLFLKSNNGTDNSGFEEILWLFDEACNYMQQFIWNRLSKKIDDVSYLKSIVDSCLDEEINEVIIFSLNHDLVLEKLLYENEIEYIDGFERKEENPKSDVRYWHPKLFENDNKVKLFKLHGSVNWFDFEKEKDQSKPNRLGIPNINDILHTKDENGNYQWPAGGKPVFLTGTKNKILDYENNKYIKIVITYFKTKIATIDSLIASGYGFGDEGINTILEDWLSGEINRKIVNINKSKPDVNFENKITTTGKYIQYSTYEEMKLLLEDNK